MRHLLLGLTVAVLLPFTVAGRPLPQEETIYAPTTCSLIRIDPKNGSAIELLNLDHESLSAPVVFNNSLYVGDGGGTLHALTSDEGKKQWDFKAADAILCVAATEKIVFAVSGTTLHAMDAATGKPLWARKSDVPVYSITLADGTVLINTKDGPVALEQSTGAPRWQLDVKWGQFVFSPLPGKRLCVWKTDEIFVIDTDSGKALWQKAADQSNSAPGALPTAAVGAGELICQLRGSPSSADDWSLHGMEAGSGRQIWNTPLGKHPTAGAQTTLCGSTAYAILGDQIFAIDTVKNGKITWQAPTKALEAGGPGLLEAHGRLYVPELGGNVTALDAKTGKVLWENEAPEPARRAKILIGGVAANQAALFVTRNEQTRE